MTRKIHDKFFSELDLERNQLLSAIKLGARLKQTKGAQEAENPEELKTRRQKRLLTRGVE